MSGRNQSLYLSIRRALKQNVVFIEAYHFCQLCTKFYPTSCSHCYLLFLFGIRRTFMRSGRNRPLYLSIRKAIKQTVVFIEAYHFC
jgi:hypothetical protein